jgi:hypothetical protein
MAGGTAGQYLSVQFNLPYGTNCQNWSLRVQALDDFRNGAATVPAGAISLSFNQSNGGPASADIGARPGGVNLSKTPVTLISRSPAVLKTPDYYYFELKYDMVFSGGAPFLVPNGTYSTQLVFQFYNADDVLVSQSPAINVQFLMNSSNNYMFSLLMQNGGEQANIALNTVAQYLNGITTEQVDALQVTAYQPYQLIVKAAQANFTNSSTTYQLPVSVVSIAVKPHPSQSYITNYTLSLSATDQVALINNQSSNPPQNFNIQYLIAGRNDIVIQAPPGSYSTTLYFTVVAQ